MRLAAVAFVLLAGCSQAADPPPDPDSLIACALRGAAEFASVCEVEQSVAEGAPFLVVRHPDGSFRRFEVRSDGSGLAAADGADQAEVTPAGEGIAVAVGADRYLFPARLAGDDAR